MNTSVRAAKASTNPDGPRRLTIIIAGSEYGGADLHATQLATGMSSRGWSVRLLHLGPYGGERMRSALESAGIHLERHSIFGGCPPSGGAGRLIQLLRLFRKERPSVLHVVMSDQAAYWHIAAALHLLRRPALVEFQGIRPFRTRNWRERVLVRGVLPLVYRPPLLVTAVSTHNRRILAGILRLPLPRMQMVPNGIDLDPFEDVATLRARGRRKLHLTDGVPALTLVGRLSAEKRPDLALDISERLCDRGIVHRLLIVGDGPLRMDLERRITRSGRCDHVQLLGHREDIPEILAACDIYLLTSDWEGMPHALLEAMAAGCVPVCFEVGGVSDILGDGECGRRVPPGSVSGLVEEVATLCSDPDLRGRMAARARERILFSFSRKRMLDGYLALYEELG